MPKPLHILMLIHRQDDTSPYCFYVHEQAKALRDRGHRVTVIAPLGRPPIRRRRPGLDALDARTPKEAMVDGIAVHYPRFMTLGNPGERLLGGRLMAEAALSVAEVIHARDPFDVVHAHMLPRDGHAGLLLARHFGIPLAITVHGTDVLQYFKPGKQPWRRNVRIAREADALLAVSSMLMERVAPYRSGFRMVVPNGVDLSLVPERRENRPRQILSVGTLKPRKCMDRTIEAFSRIAGEYPDAELTLIGTGPMEEVLRAQIERLGLAERVHLTGGLPHEEVLRRMAMSDVFVLPSWGEGYGIVYIEAMAAGCIAIGSRNEGIEDTITDGKNGFLVPAGDPRAVERILRDIFRDASAFASLREAGRQSALGLTWAQNAETMEQIYRTIRREA